MFSFILADIVVWNCTWQKPVVEDFDGHFLSVFAHVFHTIIADLSQFDIHEATLSVINFLLGLCFQAELRKNMNWE